MGEISVKIPRYRPNIGEISAKMPDIGKMKISVLVTDTILQIYRYRYRQVYRLAEYIGIGRTHIGLTLVLIKLLVSGSQDVHLLN